MIGRAKFAVVFAALAVFIALAIVWTTSNLHVFNAQLLELSKFHRSQAPSEIKKLFSGLRRSQYLHQRLDKIVDRLLNFRNLINSNSGQKLSEEEVLHYICATQADFPRAEFSCRGS